MNMAQTTFHFFQPIDNAVTVYIYDTSNLYGGMAVRSWAVYGIHIYVANNSSNTSVCATIIYVVSRVKKSSG